MNEGIGDKRVVENGLGPNGLARFDSDVLSVPGVGFVLVLEGINDLGGIDAWKNIRKMRTTLFCSSWRRPMARWCCVPLTTGSV